MPSTHGIEVAESPADCIKMSGKSECGKSAKSRGLKSFKTEDQDSAIGCGETTKAPTDQTHSSIKSDYSDSAVGHDETRDPSDQTHSYIKSDDSDSGVGHNETRDKTHRQHREDDQSSLKSDNSKDENPNLCAEKRASRISTIKSDELDSAVGHDQTRDPSDQTHREDGCSSLKSDDSEHENPNFGAKNRASSEVKCVECKVKVRKAEKYCTKCEVCLCEEHLTGHYTEPEYGSHILKNVQDVAGAQQRVCGRNNSDSSKTHETRAFHSEPATLTSTHSCPCKSSEENNNNNNGTKTNHHQQGLKQGLEEGFRKGIKRGHKEAWKGIKRARKEGVQQGHEKGIWQGLEWGVQQGHELGIWQGFWQGLEWGVQQGHEEGIWQGVWQGLELGVRHGIQWGCKKGIRMGIKWGREEGIQQGLKQGREEGIQQGREEGIQQGIQQSREEGIQQGIQQALAVLFFVFLSLYAEHPRRIHFGLN